MEGPTFARVQVPSFLQQTGTTAPLKKTYIEYLVCFIEGGKIKDNRVLLLTRGVSEGTFAVKMSFQHIPT